MSISDGQVSALPAREKLLEAGADLVRSLRGGDVLPGVRSACRAAGLPTGSFYNCFADVDEFHGALVHRLIDNPAAAARVDESCAAIEELSRTTSGADLVAKVMATAGAGMTDLLEQRAATQAQQLLSAVADGDDLVADSTRQAYAEYMTRSAARQEEALTALLEAMGCRIRSPFTVESVVTLIGAVADGLVIRAQMDPGFDPLTLLEDAVRIVFISLVCANDDLADLDEVLATVTRSDPAPVLSAPTRSAPGDHPPARVA